MTANATTRRDLLWDAAAAGGLLLAGPRPARAAARPFDLGGIAITWYPVFLYFLPVGVAMDAGIMREAGVEVKEVLGARGGGETVRTMTEGGLVLADAAAAAAILSIIRAEEPLVLVGGGTKSPGDISWVVREDSPIRSIRDLRGRTMSYTSPGSVTEQLATMSLQRAGVPPEEVKRVSAGGIGEGLALLRKGDVEACAMLEPTFSTRGQGTRILFFAREFVPNYFQTFWLARKRFAEEHGDVLRAFLAARKRGLERTLAEPKAAAALWARLNKQPEELGMTMLRANGVLDGSYHSDGRLLLDGLRTVEEGMRLSGDIDAGASVPWRRIVDQRFLEPSQRIELPA